MKHTLIVHEDKQPFVRIEHLTDRDGLVVIVARTHVALTDQGYAVYASREGGDPHQRTITYRGDSPGKGDVHVTMIERG